MKLLHAADIHAGVIAPSGDADQRLSDVDRALTRLCELAEAHTPDVVVWAGDNFQTRRPDPRALAMVARAARRIAATSQLVIVPGNHDGPDIVGNAASQTLNWIEAVRIPNVHVQTVPTVNTLTAAGVNIVSIPYPHKRGLDIWLDRQPNKTLREQDAAAILGDGIRLIHDSIPAAARDLPTVFVGHLTVAGAKVGAERVMALGWDVTLDLSVLDVFDYAALGHIHRQQRMSPKAWYAGSPEYTDFGETDQQKGFLLAEIERGANPVVTRLASGTRPIAVVHVTGDTPTEGPPIPEGAMVKIIVTADRQPTNRERRRFTEWALAQGASNVKIDVRIPRRTTIARPTLSADLPVPDAVRRYFADDVDAERYVAAAQTLTAGGTE